MVFTISDEGNSRGCPVWKHNLLSTPTHPYGRRYVWAYHQKSVGDEHEEHLMKDGHHATASSTSGTTRFFRQGFYGGFSPAALPIHARHRLSWYHKMLPGYAVDFTDLWYVVEKGSPFDYTELPFDQFFLGGHGFPPSTVLLVVCPGGYLTTFFLLMCQVEFVLLHVNLEML